MAAEKLEIPHEFFCPISHQLMSNPVVAEDGETYEKEEIEKYFTRKKLEMAKPSTDLKNATPTETPKITSPLHGKEMGTNLSPNLGIFRQIKRLLETNPHFSKKLYFEAGLITQALNAVQSREVEVLIRLIEKEKRLLEREIKDGKNLLDVVCHEGTPELLVMVLSQLRQYYPAFHINDDKKAQLLVDCFRIMPAGLVVLVPTFGWSEQQKEAFLIQQIREENIPVLEVLIQAKLVSVEKGLDEKQNTALHIAVLNNKPTVVKALINWGANSKKKNKDKIHPQKLAENNQLFELAQNIVIWRQEKKWAPLREEIQQLRSENKGLKETIDKMQEEWSPKTNRKVTTLLIAQREQEERGRRLLAEQSANEAAERFKLLTSHERVSQRAQQISARVKKEEVTELLNYTVRGQLDKIKECLNRNPALAHSQGDVTDLFGRHFYSITGFQRAVWEGDEEMWELYLKYLSEEEAYDQLMALLNERVDITKNLGAPLCFFDSLLSAYQTYAENLAKKEQLIRPPVPPADVPHIAPAKKLVEESWQKGVKEAQLMMPAWFIYLFSEEGLDKTWPQMKIRGAFSRNIQHLTTWYGLMGKSPGGMVRGNSAKPTRSEIGSWKEKEYEEYCDFVRRIVKRSTCHFEGSWGDLDRNFSALLKSSCAERLKSLRERLSRAVKGVSASASVVGNRK